MKMEKSREIPFCTKCIYLIPRKEGVPARCAKFCNVYPLNFISGCTFYEPITDSKPKENK